MSRSTNHQTAKVRVLTLVFGVLLVATSCSATSRASIQPDTQANAAPDNAANALAFEDSPAPTTTQPSTATTTPPPALEPERFVYGPESVDLTWLADQAALAVLAAIPPDADSIDLAGKPILADRVTIGLESVGMAFTRSNTPDAFGQLGTVITIHDDPQATLRRWSHPEKLISDDARAVRQETVAALSGPDLEYDTAPIISGPDSWLVAESAPPQLLAGELTSARKEVVAWSNREAQSYLNSKVDISGDRITISSNTKTTPPSIDALPYESGMAISATNLGWSTITADVTLPAGDGLWPAIWLLSADACEGAGRCSGFATNEYHEIDLLETRGSDPTTIHTTAHWWDTAHQSSTATSTVVASTHELAFERRPGLLIWRIDGEVTHAITGRVDSFDTGPHQSGEMMLLINTAVGGTFAGTVEIGRDGHWLGEALVPDSYPQPLDATFIVDNLRIKNR